MGTARRQFTDEFKREAVGLLASRGRPLNQIAQSWQLPLRGCAPGGTGVTGGRPSAGSERENLSITMDHRYCI